MSPTQSGITIAEANAPYAIVDDIPVPKPGPKELLVKSLVVGINPVESFLHQGILVTSWPAIIGSDVCGQVIAIGDGVSRFKPGDYVYGCVRVGQNEYSPFQEAFLMDEELVFKKGEGMSVEDAAVTGVGVLTSALMLIAGTGLQVPEPGATVEEKDEWIVVMGASGTVGQFAVQICKLCGYKVLAGCSKGKSEIPLSAGAAATLDHRLPLDEKLSEIANITEGKLTRFVDCSTQCYELGIKALEAVAGKGKDVYFATVDDWTPMDTPSSITTYRVRLGHIGRTAPDSPYGDDTTESTRKMLPALEAQVVAGGLKPVKYSVVPGPIGWESVVKGIGMMEKGEGGKLVARVSEG